MPSKKDFVLDLFGLRPLKKTSSCQRTIFYIIKAKFYIFVNYKKTSTPSGILSPQPKTATRESLESG